MALGLTALLETVERPQSSDRTLHYHVRTIPGFPSHYIGLTSNGLPCLLLGAAESGVKAPIRLSAIEVSFAVPCRIALEGGEERTEPLTSIACTSSDPTVRRYFIHVCETILQIVGTSPTLQEVIEAVMRLVDLFQRLSSPPRRSVVGLFGELYFIGVARSPAAAVTAWRSTIDDRFDFSVEDVRIEVKTSGTRQRSHEFSLEQCIPPPDTSGVLVSLFAEASGGGLSLQELVERIEAKLGSDYDLLLKFQEAVAEALGASASDALSMRFDESLAKSSLQVFDLSAIPAIRAQISPQVSQVRFRSDLSQTAPAVKSALISSCSALRDLLPAGA